MTKTYKFQVTAPTAHGTRYVVSRHVTRKAAEKAAWGGRGGFQVEEIAATAEATSDKSA